MSSRTLYRLSGGTLIAASLLILISSIVGAVLFPGHSSTPQVVTSLPWLLLTLITLLGALLSSMPDFVVVGEAANGREAITRAAELQPDIILMDLDMPELNGIEATRQITRSSPRIGILVLTMLEDDASVFAAMRAGARGYLLKGSDQADVLRAINAVAHGEAIFSPSIAQRLMQYFANMQPILPRDAFPDLTEREREILGLIALGKSNADIAEELVLSPKTVSNHVSNIFSKLQVVDRAQAVLRARQAGLG